MDELGNDVKGREKVHLVERDVTRACADSKADITVVVVPAVDGAAEEMLGLGEDADAA